MQNYITSDAEGVSEGPGRGLSLVIRVVLLLLLLRPVLLLLEVEVVDGARGLAVVGVDLLRVPVEERDRRHVHPLRLQEVGQLRGPQERGGVVVTCVQVSSFCCARGCENSHHAESTTHQVGEDWVDIDMA